MNNRIAVGILIYCVPTKKVFMMKRSTESSFPGLWGGISGGVERYETHTDALKREIEEELGLDILEQVYDLDLAFSKQLNTFTYYQYVGKIESEFIPKVYFPNEENAEWNWFDLEELPKPTYNDLPETIKNFK